MFRSLIEKIVELSLVKKANSCRAFHSKYKPFHQNPTNLWSRVFCDMVTVAYSSMIRIAAEKKRSIPVETSIRNTTCKFSQNLLSVETFVFNPTSNIDTSLNAKSDHFL